MANSNPFLNANHGDKGQKFAFLRLSDDQSAASAAYAEIIPVTGVPSGAYGRDAGATMLAVRMDAATVAAALYVTVNGGTAWTAMDPSAVSGADITFNDTFAAKFGTPGTDLVLTADGTDVIVTGTGGWVTVDSLVTYFGTGKDIGVTWDGTSLKVTQAAANSAIQLGVDGAGIDLILLGDTASASMTWDQSADSLILAGVAKIKLQTIVAAHAAAIPVTHSGSFPITQNGAETNTLADPTFLGQQIDIFVDTDTSGARVITAASRINQTGNTIITMTEVGDFVRLVAITIGGALKWQVVANDGAALS